MPDLYMVHGWGFGAGFWDPLRRELAELDCWTPDLGFIGTAKDVTTEAPVVAIGHSLGLMWVLENPPPNLRALVSINGFPRFTADESYPGVAPRLLARMMARLEQDPVGVTTEFLTRCGSTDPVTSLNTPRLMEGLFWLKDWDARKRLQTMDLPMLILAGRKDPIVPPAMTEAAFAGHNVTWSEHGHLLPLTAPSWCAKEIRTFL